MFPDLNVITFDGNSVAIYKAASYIITQLPNETVSVLIQECPSDSQSPVSQSYWREGSDNQVYLNDLFVFFFKLHLLYCFAAPVEFHQLVSGRTQHHPQCKQRYDRQAAEEGGMLSSNHNLVFSNQISLAIKIWWLTCIFFLFCLQALCQPEIRQASI